MYSTTESLTCSNTFRASCRTAACALLTEVSSGRTSVSVPSVCIPTNVASTYNKAPAASIKSASEISPWSNIRATLLCCSCKTRLGIPSPSIPIVSESCLNIGNKAVKASSRFSSPRTNKSKLSFKPASSSIKAPTTLPTVSLSGPDNAFL